MLSLTSENRRTGMAIALSLIVHALLLLLLPGFNAPIGYSTLGDGVPVDVSIVPLSPQEEESVTKPAVLPIPKPKPSTTPPAQPKPVVTPQPEPKAEAPRVLTTANPTAPVDPVPVQPEPEPQPEPEVIEPPAPPSPPTQREAVRSGLGIFINYPAKEAAFLRANAQVQVIVTVKPQDTPQGRLIGTTGSDELDRWVVLWAERRFTYTPWSEPYELQFSATVNPNSRQVTFDLKEPDSRVRIVQP